MYASPRKLAQSLIKAGFLPRNVASGCLSEWDYIWASSQTKLNCDLGNTILADDHHQNPASDFHPVATLQQNLDTWQCSSPLERLSACCWCCQSTSGRHGVAGFGGKLGAAGLAGHTLQWHWSDAWPSWQNLLWGEGEERQQLHQTGTAEIIAPINKTVWQSVKLGVTIKCWMGKVENGSWNLTEHDGQDTAYGCEARCHKALQLNHVTSKLVISNSLLSQTE